MDGERLTRMIRWTCMPVVPVVGLLVTVGASAVSTVVRGAPSGPLTATSMPLGILIAPLLVVPAASGGVG